MDTQSNIRLGTAHPLSALAWSGLTDDEFIERVAAEVWKRPNYASRSGVNDSGRIGVTRGKVHYHMKLVGRHYAKKDRDEIERRIYERARTLLDRHCQEWVNIVIYMIRDSSDRERVTLRRQQDLVRRVVPAGMHDHVNKLVLEQYPLAERPGK